MLPKKPTAVEQSEIDRGLACAIPAAASLERLSVLIDKMPYVQKRNEKGRIVSAHVAWSGLPFAVSTRVADQLKAGYEEAFQRFLSADHTGLCMELQTPVLLVSPGNIFGKMSQEKIPWQTRIDWYPSIMKNPSLSMLDVPSFIDPYQVFQSIEQFITGVMPGATSPTLTVSDKSQILKKGFDPVYGFRTRPNKP